MPLRVALDLAGTLEPMGDSMVALSEALVDRGIDVIPYASVRGNYGPVHPRRFYGPISRWWRYGRGVAIDRLVPPVDIVHVAGHHVPPTVRTPLLISVDDLRQLLSRDDARRVGQLQRAVSRGALIVATSYAARRQVVSALGLDASDVAVASPVVPTVPHSLDRRHIVVSVTGMADYFIELAPVMVEVAHQLGLSVVALASREAGSKIAAQVTGVKVESRHRARYVVAEAHSVIHLSDGARFPSLPIAAMGCAIPTAATSSDVNRELLEGCVDLVPMDDANEARQIITRLLTDAAHRTLVSSAGPVRAADFTPDVVAQHYDVLYRDAVAGWLR
jgi:hypothetical protein